MTEFGQFYGKNANLNMEALLKADPDVIIDIGEYKDSIASDMDGLQQQIGIPVVFIEADLENYDKTYAMLQDLLGEEEPAATMEEYARTTIEQAKEISAQIGEEEKKSVYMALGENGLSTNAKGSYHAQILELGGAENAADTQMDSKGGGSEISFEQLMLWNPDVIITDQEDTYQMILQDEMWSTLDAVKNGQVYKIPTAPFNFVSDPPSVNPTDRNQLAGQSDLSRKIQLRPANAHRIFRPVLSYRTDRAGRTGNPAARSGRITERDAPVVLSKRRGQRACFHAAEDNQARGASVLRVISKDSVERYL